MPTCSSCDNSFNDGVHCCACKKHFGFCCASITEAGFRRLGADRKAAWRCAPCKAGTASPALDATGTPVITAPSSGVINTSADPVTLQTVLTELLDLKKKLVDVPALIADVKSIKIEVAELKHSCEFAHASIKEHTSKINTLEGKCSEIQGLREALDMANAEVQTLKGDLAEKEQRSRLNNIEIKGIPVRKTENLYAVFDSICAAVGHSVPKKEINYIARVPTKDPKSKSIIVSVNNRYIKEDFMAAARTGKNKELKLADIDGFNERGESRVFINDHLTPDRKSLLNKVKAAANLKNYQYVWVKHCKIHVRKNDTSNVFVVTKENDLNKLV